MIQTISFVITCITAVISFVTLTVKLTRYITKAETKIETVAAEVAEFEENARGEHREMWDAVGENTRSIRKHDIWIAKHDAREGREMEDLK